MNVHDILDSRSNEIIDLFYTIDKIQQSIDKQVNEAKPLLADGPLLDNRDVCKLLQISLRTLQDYRDKRLIAFYKLEGKILYKMSDILRLLERNYYDAWKQKR
ncbi:helix-turn-helix domain-containing protein [Bacteroides reticulotermitis]|uniref:helix-turn-helix domain-containing protein n=1 Tax=Bacteroides reticulotermitis TaxID=1133319 RepID=UPI003A893540